MSDDRSLTADPADAPDYVGWRGLLLAELALARVPEFLVHKEPDGQGPPPLRYDFLVATADGFCFFVTVAAFSSFRLKSCGPGSAEDIRWPLDAELVRQARRSRSPVVLFVFDADTEHGRYLRLDTLPEPTTKAVAVPIPVANTITPASLKRLVSELRDATAA